MLPFRAVRPFGSSILAAALLTFLASPAAAQDADPNPGAITLSGAIDFTNAYNFRGIAQESDGLIIWPYLDLGVTLFTGEGSLKSFGVNVGIWNSLHADGLSGTRNSRNRKLWYESDFYTSLNFGLSGGVTAGLTYTAYTSPNDAFSSVKEIAFKVAVDDSSSLGKFALKPYGLIAMETDTSIGQGQADGGVDPGTYLELGVSPTFSAPVVSVAVPVKVGFSLQDYYENPDTGDDERFGFFSIGGIATYPLTSSSNKLGQWNLHGGVEYQRLGDALQVFRRNVERQSELDANKLIYTFGIGFSY